jgi:hypothetical protein
MERCEIAIGLIVMFPFPGKRNPTTGYLMIAIGAHKYADLAEHCTTSIRLLQGKHRPIQLLIDKTMRVGERLKRLVDYVDILPPEPRLALSLNKLRLSDISRFDRTLFVDVDCLLLKKGIDDHWDRLAGYDFAIPVEQRMTYGEWWGTDIAELIKVVRAPYVVKMNSGSIYFERTRNGKKVFTLSKKLFRKYGGYVKGPHRSGIVGDEMFFGLAMGMMELKLYPLIDEAKGSLMLSTIGADDFEFDENNHLIKYRKCQDVVSPHFVHFIRLQPKDLYHRLCEAGAASLSLGPQSCRPQDAITH